MKKVHIGGVYYGAHNVGDEAILMSLVNSFRDRVELSVASYDNGWINEKYPDIKVNIIQSNYHKPKLGLYVAPRKNPMKALQNYFADRRLYKDKDLYICGGATILSDCPWYSLRTIQIAAQAGTRSIIFGAGMAELSDKQTFLFVKKVCNSLEDIYVRDSFVKERLVNCGVKEEKIHLCYDPVLALDPSENLVLEQYLDPGSIEILNNGNLNIAVTLSGEDDVKDRTPIDSIREFIVKWQKKYDANIFLIPTNTRPGQDIDLLKHLAVNSRTVIIQKEFSPEDLIKFMQKLSVVLSNRLHMNILSSIVGTPSIGLVRNSKIVDFANLIGLESFNLDKLDCEGIMEYSDILIENNCDIRQKIIERVVYMKSVHKQCVQKVKEKYEL